MYHKYMSRLLVLAVILSWACNTIPGDGRLVRVDISGDFSPGQHLAIARGVRYWDVAGARLRAVEDIVHEDGPVAAVLAFDRSIVVLTSDAWYDGASTTIHVDFDGIRGRSTRALATLAAHESGHAMGLDHDSGDNVMSEVPYPRDAISAEDQRHLRAHCGTLAAFDRQHDPGQQ